MVVCNICLIDRGEEDIQELLCNHRFCIKCLSWFPGQLCPKVWCPGSRSADIVVDEMSSQDNTGMGQIAFGMSSTAMFMNLEEKLKCESKKGQLPCANVARITLQHCRHRLCFDCFAEKLQLCLSSTDDEPHCPIEYCCNRIQDDEVMNVATRAPNFKYICDAAATKLKLLTPYPEVANCAGKVLVEAVIYGRESHKKTMIVPRNGFTVDLANAVLILLKISKVLHDVDVYFKKESNEKGQFKYEKLNTAITGKVNIKDLNLPDRTTIVVDIDKQIAKKKQRK